MIILILLLSSCSPAWYKQMKQKEVEILVTYDNGDIEKLTVPDDFFFSCGCIATEEKYYVCGVRVFKELN